MYEFLRVIAAYCLYYTGIVHLALWWQRRQPSKKVMILFYHRAINKQVWDQIGYLSRTYRLMHLEDALNYLYNPSIPVRDPHDRRVPVVITFDDGYLDNYLYGLPVAKKYQAPMTLFLVPGHIENGKPFWWNAGDLLVEQTPCKKVTIEGRDYDLTREAGRQAVSELVYNRTRFAPSLVKREAFLAEMEHLLETKLPQRTGSREDNNVLPMNWQEIMEMQESGLVSFAAHTISHPLLAAIEDPEELRYEINESGNILEEKFGYPFRIFASPIGQIEHFGERALVEIRKRYSWHVTTIETAATSATDPYLISRIPGTETEDWHITACRLIGLLGVLSRLKKMLKGSKKAEGVQAA